MNLDRRLSLQKLGLLMAAGIGMSQKAAASAETPLVASGAAGLDTLLDHLARLPRRRNFQTVPMILDNRDQWDADALDAVFHYQAGPKQSWDNTDIAGPWLNVMRNSMNAQIHSFRHPDFLCVSATHGSAQFALYDDFIWRKYQIGAKLLGGKPDQNTFIVPSAAADANPADFENDHGAYSGAANSVTQLQRRGAVFLACHNAIWEHAERLIALDVNPDKLNTEKLCAEITNHLIPGAILTPGAVATLVELANAGFSYAR
jgi:hypothetical protein